MQRATPYQMQSFNFSSSNSIIEIINKVKKYPKKHKELENQIPEYKICNLNTGWGKFKMLFRPHNKHSESMIADKPISWVPACFDSGL